MPAWGVLAGFKGNMSLLPSALTHQYKRRFERDVTHRLETDDSIMFSDLKKGLTNMADTSDAALAASLSGDFRNGHAEVNGTRIHYVEGGKGTPVLLLPGWPQTWWQFHKIM